MAQSGMLRGPRDVSSENATAYGPAGMIQESGWLLAVFLALWAGVLDWRYRRIPNWLTLPGPLAGIAVNTLANGWAGANRLPPIFLLREVERTDCGVVVS